MEMDVDALTSILDTSTETGGAWRVQFCSIMYLLMVSSLLSILV